MIALVTFATGHYKVCQARLVESARPWFDKIWALDEADLSENFKQSHDAQLKFKRGWGFWVWKPWVILITLAKLKPGDVLMYCDSQCVFRENPAPLADLCLDRDGVLLFHQKREGHVNRTWTTGNCFTLMGCHGPRYWDGPQLNSAMSLWSPTNHAMRLLHEWYSRCSDVRVVGDAAGLIPNLPGFKDHRHDQSILSLLAIRDGIVSMPDPSQYGNGYEQAGRNYGQVISIDRMVGQCYPIPCPSPG